MAKKINGQKKYWWKDAKIYELYIDKFAGDIPTLTENLDYFTKLGINCLHILPHYPSPLVDEGYDVSDYRNIRPELGTLDDFKALVKAAHGCGIRIIVDFVFNHTSVEHPWFIEARSSKESPKRDYYLWSEKGTEFAGATNAFPDIKPNNWIYDAETNEYYYATFYPEQPDLNWDNPAVFEEMLANMEFWAEIGVDGFRLDAACYIIKREGTSSKGIPETHAMLKKIRARLEEKYPEVILVAEAHHDIATTKEYFGKGDECHMAYHFGLMEQIWLSLQRSDPERVRKTLLESLDIPENCQWAIFLRNHDEVSFGTVPEEERAALLAFLDPDRRYVWERSGRTAIRIANIFQNDRKKMEELYRLFYSLPGAHITYYGDEIGMENLDVREGVRDPRYYVRGKFDWQRAKLQMTDPQSLFSAVSRLIGAKNAQIVHLDEPAEARA
ncbi:MAG: trehalose synthase [Candidatus Kaiserbacteria bacterium]|nr:trehalose synthase [Candidatus Kaiserbacteria bacterium]